MAGNERWQMGGEENLRTAANAVTLTRLVVATALFAASAYLRDPALNLAGLAAYWLGAVIPHTGRETGWRRCAHFALVSHGGG